MLSPSAPLVSFFLLTVVVLLGFVKANTPLDDATVQAYLQDRGGFELAWASRPMWHFGSMRPAFYINHYPTCWPAPALNSTGQQHGTPPNKWPDAATGCPPPNTPFPTYYVVKTCAPDEIRIIYSLYFQHDGFSNLLIAKGHEHDWERIVVVWKRDATTGLWKRNQLFLSMHSGYDESAWENVENTFDEADVEESGGKDKDLVKIYPGWAKHPNFMKRETGWRDTVSQGCQREYRSNNWKYLPRREDMVLSSKDSEMGAILAGFDWGSATGGPWVAEDKVCGIQEGGYVAC